MSRPDLVKTVANMLGTLGTGALGIGAAAAFVNNALFSGGFISTTAARVLSLLQ
jgi:hypothetical protein